MTTKRIILIDIIRGVALIGILFANISGIARVPFSDAVADRNMFTFINMAFEQRFFPIFSFLFGLGLFIFMRNAERKGFSPKRLMARRLGLLILFGIAHQFLQPGEALLSYGILGFALLPFYKRSTRTILIAFVITMILGIVLTEYFVILAMFFLGLYIGQIGYFERLADYRRPTQIVWIASLLLTIPLLWAQQQAFTTPQLYFGLQNLAGIVIAVAIVTSLVLWSQTEQLLKPLAAFGRMALTNYVMQTLLVLAIALALGGLGSIALRWTPVIWLAIWPAQVLLSNIWLKRFNYGPLEWLWRWGTHGRKPTMRKLPTPTSI